MYSGVNSNNIIKIKPEVQPVVAQQPPVQQQSPIKQLSPVQQPTVQQPTVQQPTVPQSTNLKVLSPSEDALMSTYTDNNLDNVSSNNLSSALKRRFLSMKKKVPVRQRRLNQNRRLRKMLIPKNALMALNELKGNSISEFIVNPEERGFIAEVLVNSVRYEGRGVSKMIAKNNASEKALRDLIISKMVLKPKLETKTTESNNNNTVDGGAAATSETDNVEMTDGTVPENEDEEVPMMHLASFALHKLFTEWQADGFEIPDFKACASIAPVSAPSLMVSK